MRRWILRISSLYVLLMLTSAAAIVLTLKTSPLAAMGTAAISCIFKTAVAAAHEWYWEQHRRHAINAKQEDH
jgi:hypothetical protein